MTPGDVARTEAIHRSYSFGHADGIMTLTTGNPSTPACRSRSSSRTPDMTGCNRLVRHHHELGLAPNPLVANRAVKAASRRGGRTRPTTYPAREAVWRVRVPDTPFSSTGPISANITGVPWAASTTSWLTSTSPGLAYSAILAAMFTVRPK